MSDYIHFLGTAGARFVVTRQMRSSAGIWCYLDGKNFLIDPGPGTLARCFSVKPKLEPINLDAVILTHRHLDHSSDTNIMVEAMTGGTFFKRGTVFLPGDAISDEPVLYRYLREAVAQLVVLEEGKKYQLSNDIFLSTPIKHEHSVETYGLRIETPRVNISMIADTKPFDGLEKYYKGDVLIVNVVLYDSVEHERVKHMDLESAKRIIKEIQPKVAVLTHFGKTMLKNNPSKIAQKLTKEIGVNVIAAYDGYKLLLD